MVTQHVKQKLVIFFLLTTSLLFTSCSLVGLGYKYADWLIKRRIMEVVKFYSPQQERLEAELDDYMIWHRQKMLPLYKAEVDRVVARLESIKGPHNNALKSQEIYDFLMRARKLYFDSFIPLAHRVSPLLSELGPEQVDRSKTLINRKMAELKERAELSKKDYRQQMLKKWHDNLIDWFGELSEQQKAMVEARIITKKDTKVDTKSDTKPDKNSDSLLSSPVARFARAGRRMQEFFSIFEDHPLVEVNATPDSKEFKKANKAVYAKRQQLLKDYFSGWGEENAYQAWRKNVSSFMESFFLSLSDKQLEFLINKVKGWQRELEELIEV